MADYLASNLVLIEKNQPALVKRIREMDPPDSEKYIVESSRKDDLPTVRIRKAENQYIYVHSRFNPRKEGSDIVSHIDCSQKETYIVYGLGLGYHLQSLVKKVRKQAVILVIEKDIHLFRIFLTWFDLQPLLVKKMLFAVDEPVDEVVKMMNTFMWNITAAKSQFIQYRPITTINFEDVRDYYKTLSEELDREIMAYQININTVMNRTYEIFRNVFNNFNLIVKNPGIKRLFGTIPGKPAVVVAAGPSLNKQISLLREVKGKAVIICVDTALRTLLAEGIKPDIVCAVDYLQLNYDKVKGVDTEGYYLAALPTVVPDFYNHFADCLYVMFNPQPFYCWLNENLEEKGWLKSGGSVAHTCFQLALAMGCDPVIFVGLDLAFTGGVSHSANSIYADVTYTEEELAEMVAVKGVNGSTVYTSGDMASFIVSFDKMITDCKARVIDATEGGALIRGTELMPFAEAIRTCCTESFSVQDILNSKYGEKVAPDLNRIKKELQVLLDEIVRIKELSSDGEIKSGRLQKNYKKKKYDSGKTREYLEEIKGIYKDIDKVHPALKSMIESILLRFSLDYSRSKQLWDEGDSVTGKQLSEDAQILKKFFNNIGEACRIYKDMFTEALEAYDKEFGDQLN